MKVSPLYLASIAALCLAPLGCHEEPEKPASPAQAPPFLADSKPAPSAPGGPAHTDSAAGPDSGASGMSAPAGSDSGRMPNAPFAGGKAAPMSSEEALTKVVPMDPGLAPLEAAMKAAEAQMKAKPGDPKLKVAYADATYKFGHAVMTDQNVTNQRIKYRAALALYRRALAVDPAHRPSMDDKELIEAIYKQMGMSVPE
jgi:hypothetical protein